MDGDSLDNPGDRLDAECSDACGDDRCVNAGTEVLPQPIIESTDLFDLRSRHKRPKNRF
jgi:hypothetical protein